MADRAWECNITESRGFTVRNLTNLLILVHNGSKGKFSHKFSNVEKNDGSMSMTFSTKTQNITVYHIS